MHKDSYPCRDIILYSVTTLFPSSLGESGMMQSSLAQGHNYKTKATISSSASLFVLLQTHSWLSNNLQLSLMYQHSGVDQANTAVITVLQSPFLLTSTCTLPLFRRGCHNFPQRMAGGVAILQSEQAVLVGQGCSEAEHQEE